MTSSNHDFMLVMQGNGLAVIHGFVFQPVSVSVFLFFALWPFTPVGTLKRSVSKAIVSSQTKPQTRSANTSVVFYFTVNLQHMDR